jgi:hypothetical protein
MDITTRRVSLAARNVAILAVTVALGACSREGPSGSGARVAEFDMEDLQAPAMFEQLATGLRKAYLLELPPRSVDARFDLELADTTEAEVLRELAKLDPSFTYERRDDVLICYPAGAEGEQSPFTRKVESFESDSGAGAAIRELVVASGLAETTVVQMEAAGDKRPVKLDARGQSVRELLAEIARQAHLGMRNEPGQVRAFAVPE